MHLFKSSSSRNRSATKSRTFPERNLLIRSRIKFCVCRTRTVHTRSSNSMFCQINNNLKRAKICRDKLVYQMSRAKGVGSPKWGSALGICSTRTNRSNSSNRLSVSCSLLSQFEVTDARKRANYASYRASNSSKEHFANVRALEGSNVRLCPRTLLSCVTRKDYEIKEDN